MESTPFLTVVTRCFQRPQLLQKNIKSLKSQTDKDYEQIFIIDRIGKGLSAADKSLDWFKHYNSGQYIMVLDDDDLILDPQFISYIKVIALKSNPDVIIWRGQFGNINYVLPPVNTNWGKLIEKSKIGSFNYAVKSEFYNQYIHVCRSGITGDFDFINKVLNSKTLNVIWTDKVFVASQVKGKGRQINEIEERNGKKILRKNRRRSL
jgi:glycosyltransferase involved in cell wall biosynthesis